MTWDFRLLAAIRRGGSIRRPFFRCASKKGSFCLVHLYKRKTIHKSHLPSSLIGRIIFCALEYSKYS